MLLCRYEYKHFQRDYYTLIRIFINILTRNYLPHVFSLRCRNNVLISCYNSNVMISMSIPIYPSSISCIWISNTILFSSYIAGRIIASLLIKLITSEKCFKNDRSKALIYLLVKFDQLQESYIQQRFADFQFCKKSGPYFFAWPCFLYCLLGLSCSRPDVPVIPIGPLDLYRACQSCC